MLRSGIRTRRDETVGLAETMLKLHKDLHKTKAPQEQESLQRQIASSVEQIDRIVYELYSRRRYSSPWKVPASGI
jgi:hypothetical protein